MPKRGHMRHGSMQFYPRKRSDRMLSRVSWNALSRSDNGLLGFIGYKVGMASAFVKDDTPSSMTKGQRITIPITIIECPTMRILSVRFYNNGRVVGEVLNNNIDKEMKKKIKIPKEKKSGTKSKENESKKFSDKIDNFKGKGENNNKYDDIRIIIYSQVKKTGIKKKPDIIEMGMSGSLDEKIDYIKKNIDREISVKEFLNEEFMKDGMVDIRGVTKGKGLQGPTKRFGLKLKFHKSEKGVRGPGSGGAWHPARVEYTHPMAGQMGFFTRVVYNFKVIIVEDIKDKDINSEKGFKKFGKIKNDFIIVFGSVQGPSKRQLIITSSLRPTKWQVKKNYEFLELR